MSKRIMLFTLQTFSATGGIQKMTRTLGYSLQQIATNHQWDFNLWSAYDAPDDLMPQYLPAENFKGFNAHRSGFLTAATAKAVRSDIIIISHINLAIIGVLAKLFNPTCKVWLIAHGIEVWRPLSMLKKYFLKRCDKVLCVSNFTREEMIRWHKTAPNRCVVFNNAVDPFIVLPATFEKPQHLVHKYKLSAGAPVLFTLARLASTEQYKGHEQVIKAIHQLKISFPGITYILAGQSDPVEKSRIKQLISAYGVEKQVILAGFVKESELTDYFLLADLFVLPSKKEGFGIVFIESLAHGLPVVCGNSDGSIDAIKNGELGIAIKADDLDELKKTIARCLSTPLTADSRKQLQSRCLFYFNELQYRDHLQGLLANE